MILNVLRAEGGEGFKVGIVTSRRVGGAVVRNRVRRRLREIVRHHREELIADVQAVIVAKKAAAEASFQDLSAEWLRLARRASILLPR